MNSAEAGKATWPPTQLMSNRREPIVSDFRVMPVASVGAGHCQPRLPSTLGSMARTDRQGEGSVEVTQEDLPARLLIDPTPRWNGTVSCAV